MGSTPIACTIMTIEAVTCPVHKVRMVVAKSEHGSYWRCPKWGCDQKANSMGEIKKKKEDDEDEEPDGPDGFRKRRWE